MNDGKDKKVSPVTVVTRGRFRVLCPQNRDMTPSNRKERAVIALLAVSPNKRRSRQWLQSMLWSESEPQKASGSLRRALSNIRSGLTGCGAVIESNKHEVWLGDSVKVDDRPSMLGKENMLELVNAPDPAFEDWLRDFRAQDAAQARTLQNAHKTEQPAGSAGGTVVIIRATADQTDGMARFFETVLLDTLSMRFEAEGAEEIYTQVEPEPDRIDNAATIVHIELVSVVEAGHWSVHLRALADKERRFLWSGRVRLPIEAGEFSAGVELDAFATRAIAQILLRYQSFRKVSHSPLMILARASARLYDPSFERVRAAERDLLGLVDGEGAPVALAWLGFAKLARVLEFGDQEAANEAQMLVQEALTRRPGNALISALASRVAMDVTGDFDRAESLARDAMNNDDGNPYALQAAARISLLQGRMEDAQELTSRARQAAEGLSHVFAWDFELCLAALARGDFAAAQEAVRQAHSNNPQHRASLRYLIATSLLLKDMAVAENAAVKLAALEPGFVVSDLSKPDYPVLTLRNLGLIDALEEG